MGNVNMAVDFGGVKMQNPINTAAGTFGYGWQFQNFFDVSQLGAITTKGCAAEPWPGKPRAPHGRDPGRHDQLRGPSEPRRGCLCP